MKQPNDRIVIRRSGPDDAERAASLFADALRRRPGPYPATTVEAGLSAGFGGAVALFAAGRGFIAENEARMVGCAAWTPGLEPLPGDSPRRDDRPRNDLTATLRSVGVIAEFSGRGVGERLVGAAINDAARRGYKDIALFSTAGAVGFYERLGFDVVRRFQIRFGDAGAADASEMRLRASARLAAK